MPNFESQILEKLSEHDKRFSAIDKSLSEHDKRFSDHDKRFSAIEKKLSEHDTQFERVFKKLLSHDDEFVKVREEIKESHRDLSRTMDSMMVILKRLDEERVFTVRWIDRVEKKVEEHTREIKHIKVRLKIA